MFVTIVFLGTFSPLNGIICILCLLLLFFESAFGICLGCKIYNFFNKEKAKLCPGGTCEIKKREEIQKINFYQIVILALFFIGILVLIFSGFIEKGKDLRKEFQDKNFEPSLIIESEKTMEENKDCEIPNYAKIIGHEEV
jgi:hypothetical protein